MRSKAFEFLIVLVFLFILPISLVNIIPGKAATKSQVARRVDEIFEDAAKHNEPEVEFEFVPYTTVPTSEGAIWLESDEIPPSSIFYYDGDKDIEYIPKPEPNELSELTITCPCGWTHEIQGKELAYRSRYTKVIEPYECDGIEYWWYDGGFHYKTNRIKFGKDVGLNPRDVPEWTSVCNYKTEEYIKSNCKPDFKEDE